MSPYEWLALTICLVSISCAAWTLAQKCQAEIKEPPKAIVLLHRPTSKVIVLPPHKENHTVEMLLKVLQELPGASRDYSNFERLPSYWATILEKPAWKPAA